MKLTLKEVHELRRMESMHGHSDQLLFFDLGLERAGMSPKWQVEIDPFCRRVLRRHWPDVVLHEDILECLKKSMSSPADFPVRTFLSPAAGLVLPASVLDSGGRWLEPFAWWDQSTSLWRTWQRCFIEGWATFAETWPTSGMTRNGIAYRRAPSVLHTCDDECSLWPTPTASMDGRGFGIPRHDHSGRYKRSTVLRVQELIGEHGWRIHPHFTETLMGFPTGWTEITPSETQSSRKLPNGSADESSK